VLRADFDSCVACLKSVGAAVSMLRNRTSIQLKSKKWKVLDKRPRDPITN
jgi:hypothetical protein